MLSQLVAHLFTEELTAEGRKVELPPTFAEQLAAWQNPGPTSPRAATPAVPGQRAPSRQASSAGTRHRAAPGHAAAVPSLRAMAARASDLGRRPGDDHGHARGCPPVARAAAPTRVAHLGHAPGHQRAPGAGQPDAPPRHPEDSDAREGPAVARSLAGGRRLATTAPRTPPSAPQATRLQAAVTTGRLGIRDPAAEFRAAKAKQEAERAARIQKLVRNISLGVFGVVAVLILFVVLRPKAPRSPSRPPRRSGSPPRPRAPR